MDEGSTEKSMSEQKERSAQSDHGETVFRLRPLLHLASYHWDRDVTEGSVQEATGLHIKTIRAISQHDAARQPRQIALRTLGLLCWYFGCDVGDLLLWRPPKLRGFPLQPITDRIRSTPPRLLPPAYPTISNHIRERLAGKSFSQVAALTGLSRRALYDLLDNDEPARRIWLSTVSALCDYLSEDHRPTWPGDLLRYDGPREETVP